MKCNIHNEKYIWISELDNSYYCNKCINDMIEEDMYLTSNNWDYLYEYYIGLLPTCTSLEETMKLNEFNNIFQTEKDCLKYITSLKENKCIRCSWTSLNTSNLRRRTFKTYIKVEKHHVHLYAKEAAYKFNKIPSFETVMLLLCFI